MNFISQLGQKFANFLGENTDVDQLSEETQMSSDFLDPDYLADILPYRLYDPERKIYENKKSFGFVIEAIPLLGGSEEAQKELSSLIREIGEEGADIQTFMIADHRIGRFLDLWAKPRHQQGGIFAKIADKKRIFFQDEGVQGDVPPRIFRFFISYSQPKPVEKNIPFFLKNLTEKKKKVFETFARLSQPFETEPTQLIELLSGILNFDPNPSIQTRRVWNKATWISKQVGLPGSAIEVSKEGMIFHGKNPAMMRTYEAVDFPDRWSLGYMGEMIGDFLNQAYRIASPFYIHYGIHFPSQQKTETKFQGKAKVLEHQAKFPALVRMFPNMPREREENFFVQKQLLEGEKFVETRLSCGLWAAKDRFVKSESILMALFQKYGFRLKENHFIHLPDFLSSLPMAWGEDSGFVKGLKRIRCMRTTLTKETGFFIPCVGEWWGNSNQGMLLTGRRGQLATWDPFAVEGNLNTVVVGPSGSGKSVFMQEMIMNQLGQGSRVFVLDLGRSFEKLCHLLGGQYLAFSDQSQFNLNPFRFVKAKGDIEAQNAALEMVSSIIATMAMPTQKIDKERADILNAIVKATWDKKGEKATVDDVIELIKTTSFRSELMIGAAESLCEGLKKFTQQGAYANYFYGSNFVDFQNDLVVIETEELKNMADLQSVILQIFTLTISNQVFMGDRNKRCMICIDEAWDLLKSPQMEGFIESLARRLRKYNGALVIGTQSLKDFERSHGARAAFQNSNWLLMLGKDNDSINTLKRENLIPMNDLKEMALSSLRMEEGKYSEVFIYHKGSGFFSVNQLKLDPFSAALYSTNATEFQAVQELKRHGLSIEDALEWILIHKVEFKYLLSNGHKIREAINTLLKTTNPNGVSHGKSSKNPSNVSRSTNRMCEL
jgi:conjugal transfer ATP-binding protein TraC